MDRLWRHAIIAKWHLHYRHLPDSSPGSRKATPAFLMSLATAYSTPGRVTQRLPTHPSTIHHRSASHTHLSRPLDESTAVCGSGTLHPTVGPNNTQCGTVVHRQRRPTRAVEQAWL